MPVRTLLSYGDGLLRGRHAIIGVAALLLLMSISACRGGIGSPASSLPPEQLDVTLTITDDPRQADASVSMTFHHGSEEVDFLVGGVTCNGVELHVESDSKQYYGAFLHVPAGDAYRCSYNLITIDSLGRTHNEGARATIEVIAREPPAILTPHARDDIPRASPLTVTYAAAASDGVNANAHGPYDVSGSNSGWRADNGTYDGIDASSLAAGQGSVVVVRRFVDTPSGTGFRSVQTSYNVFASIVVHWI